MTAPLELTMATLLMTAIVLFNVFIFRIARANPDNIFVKGELISSLTAFLVTALIVISWAVMALALFRLTQNLGLSLFGTFALSLAMTFVAWKLLGVRSFNVLADAEATPAAHMSMDRQRG